MQAIDNKHKSTRIDASSPIKSSLLPRHASLMVSGVGFSCVCAWAELDLQPWLGGEAPLLHSRFAPISMQSLRPWSGKSTWQERVGKIRMTVHPWSFRSFSTLGSRSWKFRPEAIQSA